VHYEAVGVIGNLVHSSQNIKRRVLDEGALQPVINLLSSTCTEVRASQAVQTVTVSRLGCALMRMSGHGHGCACETPAGCPPCRLLKQPRRCLCMPCH
jgi:hypothetical protein